MVVDFTISGVLERLYDPITGLLVNTGKTLIINPDIPETVAVISHEGLPSTYVISGAHTSKDEYLVASYSTGFVGEARMQRGFSPTEEVFINNFQNVRGGESSGVILNNIDFEGATYSGLNLTVSGTGITSSGVISGTQLDGDYFVGLQASGDSVLIIEPTTSGNGLIAGRTVFLSRMPGNSTAGLDGVGFAFLLQSPDITASGYKVVCRSYSDTETMVSLYRGQVVSSSSIFTGEAILNRQISYSTLGKRLQDSYRKLWIVVEWDAEEVGTFINIGYKLFEDGDSPELIVEDCHWIAEQIDMGVVSESYSGTPYYTTDQSVRWLLGSTTNTDLGLVGVDDLYLESIYGSSIEALYGLDILARNEEAISGSIRPYCNNALVSPGYPPEASLNFVSNPNPLLSSNYGYRGVYVTGLGGDVSTDLATIAWQFEGSNASGIQEGAFRVCCQLNYTASDNQSRLGFSFLRQGSGLNDEAYTVRYSSISSQNGQVSVLKGTTYGDPIGDSTTFSGSSVASATVTGSVGIDTWLEVRWRASAALGSTEIDVYAVAADSNLQGDSFDTSPGNVDYELQLVLNYTDTSSPYVTTTTSPVLIAQATASCPLYLRQIELRRSKG